jgi:hypothetical protein
MESWAEEYHQMIHDCELRESRLNDWERNFINSLDRQLASGKRPTKMQEETLEAIWDKATKKG